MKKVFVEHSLDQFRHPTITIFTDGEKSKTGASFEDVPYEWCDASAVARLLIFLEQSNIIEIEYLNDEAREFCEN